MLGLVVKTWCGEGLLASIMGKGEVKNCEEALGKFCTFKLGSFILIYPMSACFLLPSSEFLFHDDFDSGPSDIKVPFLSMPSFLEAMVTCMRLTPIFLSFIRL